MSDNAPDWETRVAAFWKKADAVPPLEAELVAAVDALADERPADDPAALFERASARDRAGLESAAETFYRAALASNQLDPMRRARTVIQLASTLRILGQLDESEQLLTAQLDRRATMGEHQPLYDETRAFLALTYLAQGRAVEAAGLALITLAPHLSRYTRAVAGNAEDMIKDAT